MRTGYGSAVQFSKLRICVICMSRRVPIRESPKRPLEEAFGVLPIIIVTVIINV